MHLAWISQRAGVRVEENATRGSAPHPEIYRIAAAGKTKQKGRRPRGRCEVTVPSCWRLKSGKSRGAGQSPALHFIQNVDRSGFGRGERFTSVHNLPPSFSTDVR